MRIVGASGEGVVGNKAGLAPCNPFGVPVSKFQSSSVPALSAFFFTQ
jgi:hypothetical protein